MKQQLECFCRSVLVEKRLLVILYYLPPYSPFLNVAEWVFGYIKPRIRRDHMATAPFMVSKIEEAIQTITAEKVQGWMSEVGRNAALAIREQPLGRTY